MNDIFNNGPFRVEQVVFGSLSSFVSVNRVTNQIRSDIAAPISIKKFQLQLVGTKKIKTFLVKLKLVGTKKIRISIFLVKPKLDLQFATTKKGRKLQFSH